MKKTEIHNKMSLKKQVLKIIRSVLNPAGYDILKYSTTYPAQIVADLLKRNGINALLDVGANEGQYSLELRKAGYRGRIISFEPLSEAYQVLQKNALGDTGWQTFKYALGDITGKTTINVSGHSPSSSLLPMTDLHSEALPGSGYIREEKIEIITLDSVLGNLELANEKVFMKVDTQGYEKKVLEGAESSLPSITGLQLELSAAALYDGEDLYYSILRYVEERNFRLVRIIPGYTNKSTGEMLQFDALFIRK